jgi:hypothetical protein
MPTTLTPRFTGWAIFIDILPTDGALTTYYYTLAGLLFYHSPNPLYLLLIGWKIYSHAELIRIGRIVTAYYDLLLVVLNTYKFLVTTIQYHRLVAIAGYTHLRALLPYYYCYLTIISITNAARQKHKKNSY